MPDDYKLSAQMHEKILNQIRTIVFSNKTPVDTPQIYILGGQPAAGKSVLTKRIYEMSGNPNIVVINGDDFRTLHPQAPEIFQKHGKDFAAYTDPDVRDWTRQVFDEAIVQKYNIIFEGTMRTPLICDTIKNLQQQGYQIHILAMAVPAIKSRISIYARYQEQLDHYPIARFTTQKSHDDAYEGMLYTLDIIEKQHLYDTISVYNREGDLVFKTGDCNIMQKINEERAKPLTPKEALSYGRLCDELLEKMHKRLENIEFIKDLENLKQEINKQQHQLLENSLSAIAQKFINLTKDQNFHSSPKPVNYKTCNKHRP